MSHNDQKRSTTHHAGCLKCGKPIVYELQTSIRTCSICKRQYESNSVCENGHYVCDHCHTSGNSNFILFLQDTTEKDPMKIFFQAAAISSVHMHGPEHHSIVPCVLLTAFRNCGGNIQYDEAINAAVKRGEQVPGGFCGYWGACGAAIGAGIYASVVTASNPLNETVWSIPQILTAQCLNEIAKTGGPRCCKRTSRVAIETAVHFTKKHFGVAMPVENTPCTFFNRNEECLHRRCPYYATNGCLGIQ